MRELARRATAVGLHALACAFDEAGAAVERDERWHSHAGTARVATRLREASWQLGWLSAAVACGEGRRYVRSVVREGWR